MATYTSVLKENSWVTADDLGEWLFDDKPERYLLPTEGEFAFLVEQFIRYAARDIGAIGNGISIEYVNGVIAGSEIVTVVGQAIQVQIEDGVSTAEQIRLAISTSGPASALVSVELEVTPPDTLPDVQVRTQIITGPVSLSGGVDDIPFPKQDVPIRRKRFEVLINSACSKIEAIIQTNVLAKEYREDSDGNDSNVIVPSKWPVLALEDVRIDYNRNFGPETIVDQMNLLLRGMADNRANLSSDDIRIIGNDIYLRDDDSDNVIGRIFSGSVAGSVRITYTSGWARDNEDVPSDLRLATLMLAEWYEYRRSNKDIGVSSKGVRGESYSKSGELECGVPIEIYQMVEPFINHSFGAFERIQNNIFGV